MLPSLLRFDRDDEEDDDFLIGSVFVCFGCCVNFCGLVDDDDLNDNVSSVETVVYVVAVVADDIDFWDISAIWPPLVLVFDISTARLFICSDNDVAVRDGDDDDPVDDDEPLWSFKFSLPDLLDGDEMELDSPPPVPPVRLAARAASCSANDDIIDYYRAAK